jgi:hypothetical protein
LFTDFFWKKRRETKGLPPAGLRGRPDTVKGHKSVGVRLGLAAAIAVVVFGGGLGLKNLFGPQPVVITEDNPTKGSPDALITLYEFSDYG